MFEHLFHGSPTWLLAFLMVGLFVHVGSGGVAIVSGAGALLTRKGARAHRYFGRVFLIAMLAMAIAASSLAMAAVVRGHLGQVANIFGGAFAVYLVATGWWTVRRSPGTVGRAEVFGCFGALLIAAVALIWLLPLALGPEGRAQGVPPQAPFILAGVAALLAVLDLKVILRKGVQGISRTRRHLWRMCLGLFIATGSFFIGQQRDMPTFMQGSPVLLLLGLAPLIAAIFWLLAGRWGSRGKARPAAA